MSRLASGLGLLLGTLAGVCLGWLLALQLHPRTEDAGSVASAAPTLSADGAAPMLAGVTRTVAPEAKGAGAGGTAPRRTVSIGSAQDLAPLLALDGQPIPEDRGREVVRALALLYATLGRVPDFERLVTRCTELGWAASDLLPLTELLPEAERLPSLERLLAGPFAGAAVEPVLLANVLENAGARERAIALLAARLDEGPHQDAALKLIELDPKGASARLLAATWIDASESDLLSNLATAFARAGQGDLAWPFLERLLARGDMPGNALDMLEEADPALGLKLAQRVLQAQGDTYLAWHWLGRMRLAQGDASGAFDAYREALSRNVGKDAIEALMRVDMQRAYEHVKTLDTSGLHGEDLAVLTVLALHRGTTEEAFTTLARGLESSPAEYTLLNAIVRLDPARAAALLGASVASYEGEGKDELVGAYANALRIAGRSAEARTTYLEALAIDGTDVEWVDGLMHVDARAALEHLESIRSGNDDEEWHLRATAEALARTGRRAEAQAIYARLSGAHVAASLGRTDPAEGRRRLEQLIEADPRNAGHWGQLGEMERDVGNLAAARRAFAEAVALEPTGLWYLVRLRQLSPAQDGPGAEPR